MKFGRLGLGLNRPLPWYMRGAVDGVNPSLILDFENNRYAVNQTPAAFSDLLTFTRSTTATYVDVNGVVQTAAVNEPRFDYSTGSRALLVEKQVTNLLPYSCDFTNSDWIKSNFSVTGSSTIAPDGSTVPWWSFGEGFVYDSVVISSGYDYTGSIWIKANKTGTIGLRKGGAGISTHNVDITLTTEWQRFEATSTSSATDGRLLLDNRTVNGYGVADLEIAVWGAQLERSSYATSFIYTNGATVTRKVDVVTVNNLSSFINTTEGTIFTRWQVPYVGTDSGRILFSMYDSTDQLATRIFAEGFSSGNIVLKVTNSSSQASATPACIADTEYRDALAYKANDFAFYRNGSEIGTDTSGSVPSTLDVFTLGSQNGSYVLNGSIAELRYYPSRLPSGL